MNVHATSIEKNQYRRAFRVQPQDVAWVLFVAALIATAETNYDLDILLVLIGGYQILEPRLPPLASRAGQITSISVKLLIAYLLVGYTHTVFSPYYPIFLIPVVSAATIFEIGGVILVTLAACALNASFLLPVFIDWSTFQMPPGAVRTFFSHLCFFPIVAFLVYQQARAARIAMGKMQETANRLAESNRNLRLAEASLRRSERLAALGQLTAGLAHELRNPLGTIKASAEMLTKSGVQSRPAVMSEMSGFIVSEVDRMNGLISHFLDFARPLQIHAAEADLRPVVDNVFKQQSELANATGVVLKKDIAGELTFCFDSNLLTLALSNLVQNAIQASRAGEAVEVRADKNEPNLARIFVRDQGAGIPAQQLENIFNPFFTTKPNGVGLGLAIVSKVVDEHGGRIRVFSEPNSGTTFEITLPLEQPTEQTSNAHGVVA